jgi:hypothetical protein
MVSIKTTTTKNAPTSLAILMAVAVRWYDTTRIARWRMSRDSMEATGCRHQASIRSNKVLRSKLRQFFLSFFIVNS